MTHQRLRAIVLLVALLAPPLWAQSRITIKAGTPEDQELQSKRFVVARRLSSI